MLRLSTEEIDALDRLLEGRLGELSTEIHHTDTREFRDTLKREELLLTALRRKLAEEKTRIGERPMPLY